MLSRRLIIGVGTTGKRITEEFRRKNAALLGSVDIRVEVRDPQRDGLDSSYRFDEFERVALTQVLGDATELLIVTCAGGSCGSTQVRMLALFARSRDIATSVVSCSPAHWEGATRQARSRALQLDLRAMGVNQKLIETDVAFAGDSVATEEGFQICDKKVFTAIRDWIERLSP